MELTDLIPFGEWMPDQPPLSGAARNIQNVLPNGQYYRPFPGINEYGDALDSVCVGAAGFVPSNGVPVMFSGTATDLYLQDGTQWDEVTRMAGVYATTQENKWRFVQYGNRILATNLDDDVQSYVVGSSTLFADLAGSPPKAKHIMVINNFVVLGNTENANNEVAWSGLDAPTTWGTDPATQADSQMVENEGGEIKGLFGSQNYGVILQRNALVRMQYVGPPLVFELSDAEKGRGALTHYGNAAFGTDIYFLAEDGFYRFDGTRSVNISDKKVTRWFFATLDQNYLQNVTCAIDPINTIAVWGFPDVNATGGRPNRLLIYDWSVNRWTNAMIDHEYVYRALTSGYTLEQLDNVNASLDALPFSLDSSAWKGGLTVLAFFSENHALAFATDDPLEAILQTTETRINPMGRAFVSGVLPQVDSEAATVTLSHRNLPSATPALSAAVATNSYNGQADFAIDDRYFSAIVTIPEGELWNDAMGVQVLAGPTGNNA